MLQGPSGSEEVYTMPFTKENLKALYDRRENDLLNFVVKSEKSGEAHQVLDVTGSALKSYELFRDKEFDYLFAGDFVPSAIKEEMRRKAIAENLIGGTMSDFHPPSNTANTKAPNTYQ